VKASLYFCHIQKTAGTSLLALLDRYFAASEVCPQQRWHELSARPLAERNGYRFYAGHFGAGGMRALLGRDLPLMTFLREPAALARSTYLHLLRERDHRFVGALKSTRSAAEFIADPRVRGIFSNRQCAHLSFDVERDACGERVFFSNDALQEVQGFTARSNPVVTELKRFQRACEQLKSAAYFGLVERMEESLLLFAYTFSLPACGELERLREAPPQQLDFSSFDTLAAAGNTYDTALYSIAVELFEQRLSEMRAALKPYLRDPWKPWTRGRANSIAAALNARFMHESTQASTPSLAMRDALYGAGWHRRETLEDGRCFRWTGPSAMASAFVRPNTPVASLQLEVIDVASAAHLNDLRVLCDGQAARVHIHGCGPWSITAAVGARLKPDKIAHVELITPAALIHSSHHAGSRDPRRVGLAVTEIRW